MLHHPMQRATHFAAFGFLAVCVLLASGCSKKSSQTEKPPATPEFSSLLPRVGGPAGYVGSKECRACHEDQFTSWHRSYHRTMTQFVNEQSVQADFNNVTLTNDSTQFKLTTKNGEFWVRMEALGQTPRPDGTLDGLDVRLGIVTGSHHMQVFWVPEGTGNLQVGFPFTWLIPEKRWVPRNATFIRPPFMPHSAETWNIVCTRCHTTGVEPHTDVSERRFETRVAELGISCEACHGPGERHVKAQALLARTSSPGGKGHVETGEIVHPKKIPPERASQICGFCHSMKWIDPSENWRESGFRYRPGDDLEKTTPIIRPAHVKNVPALAQYVDRNPEILRDFFWPDGMIRVSGRDYNGLIESPCYKGGKFSCLSCHSPHDSEPAGQLLAKAKGAGACVQCHERFKETTEVTAHTHHGSESSGSDCYNCHMPHTTYGVLKAIRSHQISSPRVADDLATGRPNACNLCHLDKTLVWTASNLEKWYRQPSASPSVDEHEKVPHIIRLALAGDAGQRVLAAWHLSWPPALEISGTNWIARVLAELLDDPYSAVRCVAERSGKALTVLPLSGYDFTSDPRQRTPMRDQLAGVFEQELVRTNQIEHSREADNAILSALPGWIPELVAARSERALRLRE